MAFHRNQVYHFVLNENLDDFLRLVESSRLLVTFNGSSFDIPFLEHSFNIPDIGCPHVDLRWILYHLGFSGGLKRIERQFGIKRPNELDDVDGYEAVILFYKWQSGDRLARERLIQYCQADVLCSFIVAGSILETKGYRFSDSVNQARRLLG